MHEELINTTVWLFKAKIQLKSRRGDSARGFSYWLALMSACLLSLICSSSLLWAAPLFVTPAYPPLQDIIRKGRGGQRIEAHSPRSEASMRGGGVEQEEGESKEHPPGTSHHSEGMRNQRRDTAPLATTATKIPHPETCLLHSELEAVEHRTFFFLFFLGQKDAQHNNKFERGIHKEPLSGPFRRRPESGVSPYFHYRSNGRIYSMLAAAPHSWTWREFQLR